MITQHRVFQALVCIGCILQLFLFFVPATFWCSSPNFERLLSADGYGAVVSLTDELSGTLSVLTFFGFFIASIGLFFLRKWGRWLFVVLWIYGWVSSLLFGIRVSLPIQGFFGMALGTIDGAVLALAFISPIRDRFE